MSVRPSETRTRDRRAKRRARIRRQRCILRQPQPPSSQPIPREALLNVLAQISGSPVIFLEFISDVITGALLRACISIAGCADLSQQQRSQRAE